MSRAQLGERPTGDFEETSRAQTSAFVHALTADAVVDHPLVRVSAQRFLEFRIFDLTLHAWDLAVGIDADRQLDVELVVAVLEIVTRDEGGMGFGITPLHQSLPNATAQSRLLDLTGRAAD